MEIIIQKTVEMGVDTIIPTFMERTVVVDKGQVAKKLSRPVSGKRVPFPLARNTV